LTVNSIIISCTFTFCISIIISVTSTSIITFQIYTSVSCCVVEIKQYVFLKKNDKNYNSIDSFYKYWYSESTLLKLKYLISALKDKRFLIDDSESAKPGIQNRCNKIKFPVNVEVLNVLNSTQNRSITSFVIEYKIAILYYFLIKVFEKWALTYRNSNKIKS